MTGAGKTCPAVDAADAVTHGTQRGRCEPGDGRGEEAADRRERLTEISAVGVVSAGEIGRAGVRPDGVGPVTRHSQPGQAVGGAEALPCLRTWTSHDILGAGACHGQVRFRGYCSKVEGL